MAWCIQVYSWVYFIASAAQFVDRIRTILPYRDIRVEHDSPYAFAQRPERIVKLLRQRPEIVVDMLLARLARLVDAAQVIGHRHGHVVAEVEPRTLLHGDLRSDTAQTERQFATLPLQNILFGNQTLFRTREQFRFFMEEPVRNVRKTLGGEIQKHLLFFVDVYPQQRPYLGRSSRCENGLEQRFVRHLFFLFRKRLLLRTSSRTASTPPPSMTGTRLSIRRFTHFLSLAGACSFTHACALSVVLTKERPMREEPNISSPEVFELNPTVVCVT